MLHPQCRSQGPGGLPQPAHRFWIARDNWQILKEERTWSPALPPFFQSYYDEFVPTSKLDLDVQVPRDVNAIDMRKGSPDNSFLTYKSVPEAEKALGRPIALPTFMAPGFRLYSVEVPIFFRSEIIMLSYTDGANWLFIQYRPRPSLWVTLLAGAFAVKLVDKFQEA